MLCPAKKRIRKIRYEFPRTRYDEGGKRQKYHLGGVHAFYMNLRGDIEALDTFPYTKGKDRKKWPIRRNNVFSVNAGKTEV